MEDRRFVKWSVATFVISILAILLFVVHSFFVSVAANDIYKKAQVTGDWSAFYLTLFSDPIILFILIGMLALFVTTMIKNIKALRREEIGAGFATTVIGVTILAHYAAMIAIIRS